MEFEKLQSIIAEVLNIEPDEVTMTSTFVDDLGADSLDIDVYKRQVQSQICRTFRSGWSWEEKSARFLCQKKAVSSLTQIIPRLN